MGVDASSEATSAPSLPQDEALLRTATRPTAHWDGTDWEARARRGPGEVVVTDARGGNQRGRSFDAEDPHSGIGSISDGGLREP